MLARLTSNNQVTLPEAVMAGFEGVEYFEITTEKGRVVLTPVRLGRPDAVRTKLAEVGISEDDVERALAWARQG